MFSTGQNPAMKKWVVTDVGKRGDAMEAALGKFSPRSKSGSMILAILAHATLYGALVLYFAMGGGQHVEAPTTEELVYETFDEVPAPAAVAKPVARKTEQEKPQEIVKPDNAPKELQDDKSTIAGTQVAPKAVANGGSEGQGDATAAPYYKIKPKYPKAALTEGIEGWVAMKIDVTEEGLVENVRVVGGEQRNMFQDEARRAVEKWKYRPFLDENKKPIRKANHDVRVDFKLQDAV